MSKRGHYLGGGTIIIPGREAPSLGEAPPKALARAREAARREAIAQAEQKARRKAAWRVLYPIGKQIAELANRADCETDEQVSGEVEQLRATLVDERAVIERGGPAAKKWLEIIESDLKALSEAINTPDEDAKWELLWDISGFLGCKVPTPPLEED